MPPSCPLQRVLLLFLPASLMSSSVQCLFSQDHPFSSCTHAQECAPRTLLLYFFCPALDTSLNVVTLSLPSCTAFCGECSSKGIPPSSQDHSFLFPRHQRFHTNVGTISVATEACEPVENTSSRKEGKRRQYMKNPHIYSFQN